MEQQVNATATAAVYRDAMSQLLLLYSQVDRLIMEICAERIDQAPDVSAKLALAKQIGDESQHVSIQRSWMERFGVAEVSVIAPAQEAQIRAHFRGLPWLEFLVDLYLCISVSRRSAARR